jgi:hypothetical protein
MANRDERYRPEHPVWNIAVLSFTLFKDSRNLPHICSYLRYLLSHLLLPRSQLGPSRTLDTDLARFVRSVLNSDTMDASPFSFPIHFPLSKEL